MKIEYLGLRNFKAFKHAEMKDIPALCVIVGANGTGKSTVFNIFGFLKDALQGNVNTALMKLGGNRGFQEVRSRNCTGPIEIELKFREKPGKQLITYHLKINENHGRAFVEKEVLKYRRGSSGKPWRFLDSAMVKGWPSPTKWMI